MDSIHASIYLIIIHMHISTHTHVWTCRHTHTTHAHIQPASGLSCWKLTLLAAASSNSALTMSKALAVCMGSSLWQTEPNIVQTAAEFSRVFRELLPQGHRIVTVRNPHLQHYLEFVVFVCCALEHKMNSAVQTKLDNC